MSFVRYTAKRSLVSGHSVDTQYEIEFGKIPERSGPLSGYHDTKVPGRRSGVSLLRGR